jgi:hypothetical protein
LSLPQNSVEKVLSLSFTLFACRRLSQEKRNKKKKPNHNARSLHDLGRPRAAESRRGGPDGPRRGSAVSVGGHGGGAEQGRDGRERSIEASQSLSLRKKQTTASLVALLRPPPPQKKKFHLLFSAPLGMSRSDNVIFRLNRHRSSFSSKFDPLPQEDNGTKAHKRREEGDSIASFPPVAPPLSLPHSLREKTNCKK